MSTGQPCRGGLSGDRGGKLGARDGDDPSRREAFPVGTEPLGYRGVRCGNVADRSLLLIWQWRPATGALVNNRDPSASLSYFQPLLDHLAPFAPRRIEIPFTNSHWETDFVAARIPLARGWERQLDHKYYQLLYEKTLSVADYRMWLIDNAVEFVALPTLGWTFRANARQHSFAEAWKDFIKSGNQKTGGFGP